MAKRTKKHPGSIFWIKDGEVIVEIEKSKYFWVSPKIWRTIMSMFSLEDTETQQVIKDWLEEHYKLGNLTPKDYWDIRYQVASWKNITN